MALGPEPAPGGARRRRSVPGAAAASQFELGAAGAGLLVGGLPPARPPWPARGSTTKFALIGRRDRAAAVGTVQPGTGSANGFSALRAVNALKVRVKRQA